MKKILITGGNGLLGQSLRLLAPKEKYEIIATGLGTDRLKNHSQIYHPLDISIKKDCEAILSYYNPDIIINTAAITNVDYCELNQERCLNVNTHSINNFLFFL